MRGKADINSPKPVWLSPDLLKFELSSSVMLFGEKFPYQQTLLLFIQRRLHFHFSIQFQQFQLNISHYTTELYLIFKTISHSQIGRIKALEKAQKLIIFKCCPSARKTNPYLKNKRKKNVSSTGHKHCNEHAQLIRFP